MTKTRSAGRRRSGGAESGSEARTAGGEFRGLEVDLLSDGQRGTKVREVDSLMLNAEREERSQEPTAACVGAVQPLLLPLWY